MRSISGSSLLSIVCVIGSLSQTTPISVLRSI
jgi:hypothetical protein